MAEQAQDLNVILHRTGGLNAFAQQETDMRLAFGPAVAAGLASAALLAPTIGWTRTKAMPVARTLRAHLEIGETNGQFVIRPTPAPSQTSPDLFPIGASIRMDARLLQAGTRHHGELAR